jgi:quercetin dioxygenase-like cupin family protein
MIPHRRSVTSRAALLAALLATAAQAGQPAQVFKRTPVARADVAAAGREAVVMKVELAAGGHAGRHTHPGDEIAYIVDGEGELLVEGEPARRVRPGEAFVIKAGTVHDLANDGAAPIHAIGVYVVDKDRPLAAAVK